MRYVKLFILSCIFSAIFWFTFVTVAESATILSYPDPVLQRMLDNSKAPQPNVTLNVHYQWCPSPEFTGRSCVYEGLSSDMYLNHYADFYHELGHIFDLNSMTDLARGRFLQLIHDHHSWSQAPNAPKEKFAVAYALCAEPSNYIGKYFDYNLILGPKTYHRICRLLRLVGNAYA